MLASLFRPSFNLSRWLALLLTLLGLSISAPASAQQSASFTVSPSRVSVGQTVSAVYRTQGGFDTLLLDWGDGTRDPLDARTGTATHKYSDPKTYTVQLVLDGKPADRAQVTVTEATTCTISAEPNPAIPGETVALSVQFSGPITSKYGIDFGDGSVDNFGGPGPNKSVSFKHTYKAAGPQIVVVNDLASGQPLCRLVVTVKPPVVEATTCEISAEPSPANVGETVTFNVQFGGPTTSKYSIDFGDGSNQAFAPNANKSATFKHAYKSPGTQIVVVTDLGNDNKVLCRLTVKISEPEVTEATLSLNPNPVGVGEAVTATLGNLNPTFPHTLDWGDGTVVPASGSPKHSYAAPGVYIVKLQGNRQVPVTASLRVNANALTLSLDPNPASVGQVVTATLGNLPVGAAASLDWGDGSVVPATGSPKHSYASPGVYLVKLGITNSTFSVPPVTVSLRVTANPLELSVDPNPAEVGQQVTATTGRLLPGVAYTLDWGDGSVVPASASQKHTYAAPGVYIVRLSASEQAPVTVSLTVKAPTPDLSLNPNPAEVDESVTASLDSLVGSLNYSLDWGDGSVVPVKGNGKASAKHVYAAPGVYLVKLSADGLAPVTVSLSVKLPIPELSLDPNPAEVGQTVTASLGKLVGGTKYTLDWGEGAPVPISGLKAASLNTSTSTHKYAAPGVYLVKLTPDGAPPVTVSLNVKVPKPTLDAEPNPARVGETVTATPGNTVPGLNYSLDWGDGSVVPATAAPLKHIYATAGTYILKLSVDGAPPALVTLKVEAGLDVSELRLHFTAPEDATTLSVIARQRLDAALELDYAGQGSLAGDLLLDGKIIARAVLNAVKGETKVSFPIPNLATTEIGVHTLQYQPDAPTSGPPVQSTPPAITYTVKPVPSELEIGGFVFKITSLKNPSFSAFEGTATHSLVVGGVEAFTDVKVNFSKLTVVAVSDERVRVTGGEIAMSLTAGQPANTLSGTSGFKWFGARSLPLPAGLGGFKVLPERVSFTPTSADLSGQVSLATICTAPPDPSVPRIPDDRFIWEGHPTILDIISSVTNPLLDPDYATIQDISFKLLFDKGALPVVAAPMNVGGNGPVARPMSTRRVIAQGNPSAYSAANKLGHSQDFRFSALQGNPAVAVATSTGKVYSELFKYCRPDETYTYPVTAALKPVSGDLYGSAPATLANLKVPTTGLDLSGSATLTLDLSAAQTAPGVDGVLPLYDAVPTIPKPSAGGGWMGLLLDQARAGIGNARTGPISATLRGGYSFGADLAPGEFTDRGWTFNLKDLKLQVIENHTQNAAGSATAKVPLFDKQADVAISVPDSGQFHYTLESNLARDFGKSEMTSGGGAWIERGAALDLQLSAATWDLKELSTLKPQSTGGGSSGASSSGGSSIKVGTLYTDFSKAAGVKSYVGNVPDTTGGFAVSSAISTSVSTNASALLAGALGTAGGTGVGASGTGSTGSLSLVTAGGAISIGSASAALTLPFASLDGGVASLGTLTFTAGGKVRFGASSLSAGNQMTSGDGLSRATLSSPGFRLLGQTFNIQYIVIGGAGGGYTLGLDGQQQLSTQTPSTAARMRYQVAGGKNLSLSLLTDGFEKRVDPNAVFRVEGSDIFVALSGTAMYPASGVRASLSADEVNVGLREVPGGYELTIKGGLDTGQGASVIAVSAEALFGLTSDPYFYVKASVDSRSPIVTVLGAFNLYGFTGGVAYNMKWPDNATIPDYAKRPVKSGDGRLQIIGGITAAFETGSSLHFKSIFKIDTQRGFELTADGWILTPMNQGVFGGKAAQSRILVAVTGDGFDMRGCLGPQDMDGLNCGNLSKFTLASVVDITAWMHVRIADQKFVKIGTYGNPITARLNIPVLGGVESRGYLIIGQAFENGDRKNNATGTGIFTGYAFDVRLGAAGSLGKIGWPLNCYPWARARFEYGMNIDVGLALDPLRFDAGVGFHAELEARAGCAGRDSQFPNKAAIMAWNGKSIGITVGADVQGQLRAFNPIAFTGSASVEVDIPIIPTFTVGVSVSF